MSAKLHILFILLLFPLALSAQTVPPDTTAIDSLALDIRPDFHFGFLADSTYIRGSRYGSFADIFDWLPGGYAFRRGSVGQPAPGLLFAGHERELTLDYDGLILNDPLTGVADLNLIPTESVQAMQLLRPSGRRENPFTSQAGTLSLEPVDLASLPIRSRVAYRTGTGYDDNDARLGVQATPELAINAGGILKNYAGTKPHSKYRAQKVNVKIRRSFPGPWIFSYVFLMNKFDLDIPWSQDLGIPDTLVSPHHKDVRYDHGLSLQTNGFRTFLQFTHLNREEYLFRQFLYEERIATKRIETDPRVSVLRSTSHLDRDVPIGQLRLGLEGEWATLKNESWGRHTDWSAAGLVSLANESEKFFWDISTKVEHIGSGLFVAPELSGGYSAWPGVRLQGWLERKVQHPSFEARFKTGPLVIGTSNLKPEQSIQLGLALRLENESYDVFFVHSWESSKDRIGVRPMAFDPEAHAGARFANLPAHQVYAFDAIADYRLNDWFSMAAKFHYSHVFGAYDWLAYRPEFFGKAYVQIHRILFDHDLNARLRVGTEFIGTRYGPLPFYLDEPSLWIKQGPQILPYVHGIFIIKDATLFVAMENPLGLDYERLYGFPFPKAQFRWGFVWNFID